MSSVDNSSFSHLSGNQLLEQRAILQSRLAYLSDQLNDRIQQTNNERETRARVMKDNEELRRYLNSIQPSQTQMETQFIPQQPGVSQYTAIPSASPRPTSSIPQPHVVPPLLQTSSSSSASSFSQDELVSIGEGLWQEIEAVPGLSAEEKKNRLVAALMHYMQTNVSSGGNRVTQQTSGYQSSYPQSTEKVGDYIGSIMAPLSPPSIRSELGVFFTSLEQIVRDVMTESSEHSILVYWQNEPHVPLSVVEEYFRLSCGSIKKIVPIYTRRPPTHQQISGDEFKVIMVIISFESVVGMMNSQAIMGNAQTVTINGSSFKVQRLFHHVASAFSYVDVIAVGNGLHDTYSVLVLKMGPNKLQSSKPSDHQQQQATQHNNPQQAIEHQAVAHAFVSFVKSTYQPF